MIKLMIITQGFILIMVSILHSLAVEHHNELQKILGKKDCTFITDEYTHVWKEKCTVTITGVEIRK
jgi:hypothetical protein